MVTSESEQAEIIEKTERGVVASSFIEDEDSFEEEKLRKAKRTFEPPLLRPSSTIVSSRRTSENVSHELAATMGSLTKPATPVKFDNISNSYDNGNINISSCKAFYYSQLSIMLFERAVEENMAFPEDLDRVHGWFTKELSDTQKLVCLHELLSLISPSQHRFLFTSVAVDTNQNSEEEAVWLDLAMTEAQKQQSTRSSNETMNKLDDRLKSLDLRPGESLFSGLNITKSKFPTEKTEILTLIDDSFSLKDNVNFSNLPSLTPSSSLASSQSQTNFLQCLSPVSSSDTSKFSAILKMPMEDDKSLAPGSAPPGFLSPTAPEFRPSEPSCHAEIYMTDFSKWLRLLRLHKYDTCLTLVYEKDKIELLKFDESRLEADGVNALGARTKLLRLFARVRNELSV